MNFDGLIQRREPSLPDFQPVYAVRQTLHRQAALIVGRQSTPILVSFADDLDRGSHPKARGVGNLDVQFAGVALAMER